MEFDLLTYIGRFQPFHRGHKAVVDEALKRAKRVAIGLGSHDRPPDIRNPWSTQERINMIAQCFDDVELERIVFVPLVDHTYNLPRWLASVESAVYSAAFRHWQGEPYKIGIIGFDKDETSFYLHHFPQWERVELKPTEIINATAIRTALFRDGWVNADVAALLTDPVDKWIDEWAQTDAFVARSSEWYYLREYKEKYGDGPFCTADTLVINGGHVLLIERGPGYGRELLALPGGFVGLNERTHDAAFRELKEETGIKVNDYMLKRQIENQVPRLFDDPLRSRRGRIYTHCYKVEFDFPDLPKIKGGDDAAKAMWVSPGSIRRNQMFEDHYDIIEAMGVL